MSNETLYRATLELLDTTGRTLSGLAVPWDRSTRVRDLTGPAYLEAFAPDSADRSIAQRMLSPRTSAGFPFFVRHDYAQDPIGVVKFQRSAEGLVFEAVASKTQRADEYLEMVNDGSMRSVSVGFRPIRSVQRGDVTVRAEVALRELSLAPSGFGQYPDAGVTAVRTEPDALLLDIRRAAHRYLDVA